MYIRLGEFSKFKSYIKRQSVDVIGLLDNHGNSLLHLACMYGCEVILRWVLLALVHSPRLQFRHPCNCP